MELRHLSGFVAVAEERSFMRASERLHVSQPAVSRLVCQVGRGGSGPLERSSRHVALTPAG